MPDRIDLEQRALLCVSTGAQRTLKAKRSKGCWTDDVYKYLDELDAEIRELRYALRCESTERQWSEACDVAASAAIVSEIVMRRMKP